MLEGLVDIYLPDFKYVSPDLAKAYSAAPDYADRATEAVLEMYRQTGKYEEKEGLAVKGVILRHLVLPGCRADSIAVLRHIASILPPEEIRVSVMRQYTPDFAMDCPHKNLRRRVTEFEYTSVLDEAARLGLTGFSQGKDASTRAYTPDFEGE
jgi:putative pyruvate formate lyase activating enzyme